MRFSVILIAKTILTSQNHHRKGKVRHYERADRQTGKDGTLAKDELSACWTKLHRGKPPVICLPGPGPASRIFLARIYISGLIEFTTIAVTNCYYCGIRHSNAHNDATASAWQIYCLAAPKVMRWVSAPSCYRGVKTSCTMTKPFAEIIRAIKKIYPDCAGNICRQAKGAVNLPKFYGREQTAIYCGMKQRSPVIIAALHPRTKSRKPAVAASGISRKTGFQVGTRFMVGSPYQTTKTSPDDLLYQGAQSPDGEYRGPFIPAPRYALCHQARRQPRTHPFLLGLLRLNAARRFAPRHDRLGNH